MKKLILVLALVIGMVCSLAGQTSGPMDLVVLLDTSASMSKSYEEVSDYLTGPFLREFLRIGDTFHLISFSGEPKLEISRRVEGVGEVETIIGRLMLMYPLAKETDVASVLDYGEKYASTLPESRHKKIILITDGDDAGTDDAVSLVSARMNISRAAGTGGADLQYIKVPITGTPPVSGRPRAAPQPQAPATVTAQAPVSGVVSQSAGGTTPAQTRPQTSGTVPQGTSTPQQTGQSQEGAVSRPGTAQQPPAASSRPQQTSAPETVTQRSGTEPSQPFASPPQTAGAQASTPARRPSSQSGGQTQPGQTQQEPPGNQARTVPPPAEIIRPGQTQSGGTQPAQPASGQQSVSQGTARSQESSGAAQTTIPPNEPPSRPGSEGTSQTPSPAVAPPLAVTTTPGATTATTTPSESRAAQSTAVPPARTQDSSPAETTPARQNNVSSGGASQASGGFSVAGLPLPLIILLVILALLILGLIIFFASTRRLRGSPNRAMAQAAVPPDTKTSEMMSEYAAKNKNSGAPPLAYTPQKMKPMPKDKPVDQNLDFENGSPMLSLFVEDQNTAIGRRNIHAVKAGYTFTVGGGKSDFLIFLVPVPPHIADVTFDGRQCTFVPRKPQYFPDIGSQQVPNCIGKTIRVISDRNYELHIRMERYEDPLKALNSLLHSIQVPG